MPTSITTINSGDLITNSRATINSNFDSLNTNKIETNYLDDDTTLAANSDSKIATQKAVKAYVDAGGNVNASTTQKGIVEEATSAEVIAGTATGGTGARLFVNPSTLPGPADAGDGSDGALAITSGTTTIDLGGLKVVTKQYTSFSISGTGQLAFTNPHAEGTLLFIRCRNSVTITSSAAPNIDMRGIGAAGGAASQNAGNTGTNSWLRWWESADLNRGEGALSGAGTGGVVYRTPSLYPYYYALTDTSVAAILNDLSRFAVIGSGGGSGRGNGTESSGAGGRGGGSLILICGGDLNFTATISASGQNGGNGANGGGGTRRGCGGGGGGGAGSCVVFYKTATATSGTITTAGGNGGASGTSASTGGTQGRGGAGAGSVGGAGGNGGTDATNGSNGAGTGAGGGGGGADANANPLTFAGGTGGATFSGFVMQRTF